MAKTTKPKAAAKSKATGKTAKSQTNSKKQTPHRGTEIEEQALAGSTVLTPEDSQPMLSTGSGDTWDFQTDPQVSALMAEEEGTEAGGDEMAEELSEYTSTSPILSGGDVDADWQDAGGGGEETVGGDAPTPDQDRVDELGQAAGLVYQADEPLDTEDKMQKRDTNRWELDPASDGR